MSTHTCHTCGRERHSDMIDMIDTPRGTLTVCRDTDTAGDCLAPTHYRVVGCYEPMPVDHVGPYDYVRIVGGEREAIRAAHNLIGRVVRVGDYLERTCRVRFVRAEALIGDEWRAVCDPLRDGVAA